VLSSLKADVFPALGTRPIAEIRPPELLDVLRVVEKRGALEVASRLKQRCRAVFRYAIATGRAESDPTRDLDGALKTPKRENYAALDASELPAYLGKLAAYDGHPQTRLALRLLAYTFVRTTELRAAEWSEFDEGAAEWRIPAARMKMRDEHIVPLSRQSLAVLAELRALNGHRRYVFMNLVDHEKFMSENTMLYAIYRMGYHSRATGHGFRATASTILNEQGFKSDVIERQLAHAERNKVRAAYNRAQYLPERRKMMQHWADYLDALESGADVVPLHKAA
jgi:integrase